MTMSEIDYQAVFRSSSCPTALLTPDFVICDANVDFLAHSGRSLEEVVGHNIFDAFPASPADPEHRGGHALRRSLEAVLATGERDAMDLMRYDLEVPGHPGVFDERYWAVVNTPVFGPDGRVALIQNKAEEATFIVKQVLRAQAVSG
jgi:PAS domain-containing protein